MSDKVSRPFHEGWATTFDLHHLDSLTCFHRNLQASARWLDANKGIKIGIDHAF